MKMKENFREIKYISVYVVKLYFLCQLKYIKVIFFWMVCSLLVPKQQH